MNLRCPIAVSTFVGLVVSGTVPLLAGDSLAPSALERAYELDAGHTVKRNAAGAARLYAEAAAAGDAIAEVRLGYMSEIGDGVPQDYAAARAHYAAAAGAGLPDGHLHLAICYLEGWGGPADRAAFVREVQTAADLGDVNAARMMAGIYAVGVGVPRDSAVAMQWLERAAKAGDPYAQDRLGHHAEVQQVRQLMHDETLARSWYQLSAEKDYTAGMRAMARTFLTGPKQDRNWELGHKWLEMAMDGGDAEAPYILALFEMLGTDAPSHDEARALSYLKLASERGNEKATEVLQLHEAGKPLDAAFKYMLQVPFDERYVQRSLSAPLNQPTHPPAAYKIVRPVYPFSLRLSGVTGKVQVDFVVDTAGRVQRAHAVQSSHPLFAERAVRAVEQWRFYPAMKNGRVVNTHMQVPVIFQLEEEVVEGVDGLLKAAHNAAEILGGDVLADASDLVLARPTTKLAVPHGVDGQPLASARVMMLLVIDPMGTPVRGHVLDSQPKDAGPLVLDAALKGRFVPHAAGTPGAVSHEVLVFSSVPADRTNSGLQH